MCASRANPVFVAVYRCMLVAQQPFAEITDCRSRSEGRGLPHECRTNANGKQNLRRQGQECYRYPG